MKIKRLSDFKPNTLEGPGIKGVDLFPMITAKDGALSFAMRLFELKADGNTPKHQHEWEHEVFISDGSGKVLKDGEYVEVKKGDFILILPDELHQFKAGKQGMRFICVVPNKGQPD